MIVVIEGGLIVAPGGATGAEITSRCEEGVVEVVDVFGAVTVAVEGVVVEGGGHELHGAGGASVGAAGGVAALAGFDAVHGG